MAHDTLHPSRARGARPGRTAGAWIDGVLRDVRSGTREPFAVSVRGDLVMVGPVPAGEAGAPGEQPGTVGLLPPRAVPGCLCLDLQGDERRTCVMLSDGPAFLGEFTLGPDDREDLVSLVIAAVEGRARIEYSVFPAPAARVDPDPDEAAPDEVTFDEATLDEAAPDGTALHGTVLHGTAFDEAAPERRRRFPRTERVVGVHWEDARSGVSLFPLSVELARPPWLLAWGSARVQRCLRPYRSA